MVVQEDTVHLLAGQKRIKDECKDPDVLPKVNKVDMTGTMESIKDNLRSHCGVVRAPLAYITRKTIIVLTYGDYPAYVTHDDEMITRMLHLPPDKNRLHGEKCTISQRA